MADLQLVTPDDYAVRFQVPHQMYLNFKEYYERSDHAGDTKPVLVAFEEVIRKEVEEYVLSIKSVQDLIKDK